MCQTPRISAFIVGAQKSSTTSLAIALSTHPSIRLAHGKEAHLFDRPDVQQNGLPDDLVESSFPTGAATDVLLDATPSYLYLPGCLEAMARHNGDAVVIAILRNPAERAISHFLHERRRGVESSTIVGALVRERRRLRTDRDPLAPESAHRVHSYVSRSRYLHQLEHLLRVYPRALVFGMDELADAPATHLNRICVACGIAPVFASDFRYPEENRAPDGESHRIIGAALGLVLSRQWHLTQRLIASRQCETSEGAP